MKRAAVALIDEARCIGCARCLDACPVDAIVGARQQMHTVVEGWCIGCKLCLPPCPVDCIDMVSASAFTKEQKEKAAMRARNRKIRLAEKIPPMKDRKAILAAALARKRKA